MSVLVDYTSRIPGSTGGKLKTPEGDLTAARENDAQRFYKNKLKKMGENSSAGLPYRRPKSENDGKLAIAGG